MSMDSKAKLLPQNIADVRRRMAEAALSAGRPPEDIQLCAVCKGQDAQLIRQAAALDIDCFGENRMQEMLMHAQADAYAGRPCHFIGHLQTNKVRQVVGMASLIESVDSERLLCAIGRTAQQRGLVQDILIQINIGEEASKTGAPREALWPLLELGLSLPAVRLRGLMAIPPAFDNGPDSRRYFALMRSLFEQAKARLSSQASFDTLSMGMSDSYVAAIHEGATLIRVGRSIFGDRV